MTTSSSPVRERRDIKALENRRITAGRRFARNVPQAEIARELRVSRTAVHYWHKAWKRKNTAGLKSKRGVFGRAPRLTEKKIEQVKAAILAGPKKAGHATDLWTLSRIAALIKKKTRVSYHPGHVWKILQAMNFSAQIPSVRARERNETQIKQWKDKIWPKIKKRGAKLAPA